MRLDGTIATIRSLVECTKRIDTGRLRFFGTNLDITAQKQAETALVANEERLRQAVRLGRLGIFDHDHASGLIYWSPEQNAIWGLGTGHVPLELVIPLTHPEERDRVQAAVARSHDPSGDGSFEVEHRIVTPDGKVRWIHARAQTYFEGTGSARRPTRTVGATADVTERKQVEIDLRVKDNALDSWIIGMLIIGLDRRIAYANPAWLRMHGFDRDTEVLGRQPFDFIADPARHARIRESVYTTGSWMGEVVARRGDGSTFDAELSINSVSAADGSHVAFLGSIQDVTERRRADAQVRRSEAILRSVFEASKDAIVVTKDQRMLFANRGTAEMYGFDSPGELEGLPLAGLVPASELPRVLAINKAREEGRPAPSSYETKGLRRNGTEFDAEISASTYTIDGLVYPVVVIRDVSARKASERALRESAERLSKVFNSTSDAQVLYRVARDGRLVVVSANEAYRMVRTASFPGVSTAVEGRDRKDVLAEQGMSPEQIEMEMPAYRQVVATRQPVSHELEIPLPDGDIAIVEAHIEPVLDSDGRCTHVLWVGRNITERRRSEEAIRQLNVELERRVIDRTAQLEAANHELEAFAYSVSHDLRAPARAVDSYAGILVEDYGTRLDAEGMRLCGVVRSEAQRMGRLIDDLLMFSRLGRMAVQTGPVAMTSLAGEVFEELISAQDRTRITFQQGALPDAEGDRALLRQVWINLLANALKFSAQEAGRGDRCRRPDRGRRGDLHRHRQRRGFRHGLRGQTVRCLPAPAHRLRVQRHGRGPGHRAAHRAPPRRARVGRGGSGPGGAGSRLRCRRPARRDERPRYPVESSSSRTTPATPSSPCAPSPGATWRTTSSSPTTASRRSRSSYGRPDAERPRVILLDLKLPKLDGLEVLRKLKSDDRTRAIPVVIVTSSKQDPDIKTAYDLGANSYVVKPVDFESFMKIMSQLGFYWLMVNQVTA